MKKVTLGAALALLSVFLATPVSAQIVSGFGGLKNAYDYAYGYQGAPLAVASGNAATGSGNTITLVTGQATRPDGQVFYPLATNAPITLGIGSNQETVTPTAVSNCNLPPTQTPGPGSPTCTVTANFTKLHGQQEPVSSGTFGLQEAINSSIAAGGVVLLSPSWALAGGTNTIIGAATSYSNVFIQDNRGLGTTYWSMQPTTLTSLAVPTTLTSSTVFSASSGTGTWTAAAVYACVTYVDALGGEGPCSATYNFTATASVPVTFVTPAASTGAVGWRAYAGASYNGAYLLPITSTACTLTTLESVVPACAIGSNATFTAIYASTTDLRPNGQTPTVNLNLPMPQGHTTFAYQPTSLTPQSFQTNYGPFPSFGGLTAGQIAILGSVNLPTGFLNTIGRTVRVTGKITYTGLNTATLPYITLSAGWAGGLTAGAPIAICSLVPAAAGATGSANQTFSCTMTTNAVGATAVGSVMTNGWELLAPIAGGAGLGYSLDTGTAAIGSLGLFAQDTLNVVYTSTTNATTTEQLLDLHVEVLQ